jgi:hypothetical protein
VIQRRSENKEDGSSQLALIPALSARAISSRLLWMSICVNFETPWKEFDYQSQGMTSSIKNGPSRWLLTKLDVTAFNFVEGTNFNEIFAEHCSPVHQMKLLIELLSRIAENQRVGKVTAFGS